MTNYNFSQQSKLIIMFVINQTQRKLGYTVLWEMSAVSNICIKYLFFKK